MHKQIVFVTRRVGMDPKGFQDYWRDSHGPLVRASGVAERYLRAYVQAHTALEAYAPGKVAPAYDGMVELYFDRLDDRDAFFADSEYLETIHPDEKRFADLERCHVVITDGPEVICGPGPAEAAGVKLVIGVKRRPDLTVADWRRHMRELHGPLVRDHPASQRHLLGYVQCFAADSAYAEGEPAADAVSEMYFADLDAMNAFLDDADYRAQVLADGAEHADTDQTVSFPTRTVSVIPLARNSGDAP